MKPRTLLIGIVWSALAAVAPVGANVLDDCYANEFTDWSKQKRLAIFYAAGGAVAYWRKHKAELRLPEEWAFLLNEPSPIPPPERKN